MPLNSEALDAVDELRREQNKDEAGVLVPGSFFLPDLAQDEYIGIRHVRDFPRDMDAEMASMRRMTPIPLDTETPAQAAAKEKTVRRNDTLYWRAVWDYMCVRLHVRIDGEWADGTEEKPTHCGTQADRDKVWSAWGPYLQPKLQERFGSIAPLIPDGEVGMNGKQTDFRPVDRLRTAGDSGAGDAGGPDPDRTGPGPALHSRPRRA